MSAILDPMPTIVVPSRKPAFAPVNSRDSQPIADQMVVAQAAPSHVATTSPRFMRRMIVVTILVLLAFGMYASCRIINGANQNQANAQWVYLLIHNFNNNTPVTPFNGNQWGAF